MFHTPEKKTKRKLLPFSRREENTGKEYRRRCPSFPRPHTVYRLPSRADFEPMSGNQVAVSRWLMLYARTVSNGKDILVAPDVEVVVDHSSDSVTEISSDPSSLQEFYRRVVLDSKLGLLSFVYRRLPNPSHPREWVHAIACIVDARDASEQGGMEGSVQCYFVDPTGNEILAADADFASSHRMLRKVVRQQIADFVFSSLDVRPSVRTFVLRTPDLNDHKTLTMNEMDAQIGLHIQDHDPGFCQPWVYIILLDVICAPNSFLRKNHFQRLWDEASGNDPDPEVRRYIRLLYVRVVLSWIVVQMRPTRQTGWKGRIPFSETTRFVTVTNKNRV
jgi:hypothetical protein